MYLDINNKKFKNVFNIENSKKKVCLEKKYVPGYLMSFF